MLQQGLSFLGLTNISTNINAYMMLNNYFNDL